MEKFALQHLVGVVTEGKIVPNTIKSNGKGNEFEHNLSIYEPCKKQKQIRG